MAKHSDLSSPFDLAGSGLDCFETELLTVLRHFCVSFSEPGSQGWKNAYSLATARWGIGSGPKAAQALLHVIDAMQSSRRSVFRYNNPACLACSARMTLSEHQIMRVLHAARRERNGEARAEASALLEGGDGAAFLLAVYSFACLFPAELGAGMTGAVMPCSNIGRVN